MQEVEANVSPKLRPREQMAKDLWNVSLSGRRDCGLDMRGPLNAQIETDSGPRGDSGEVSGSERCNRWRESGLLRSSSSSPQQREEGVLVRSFEEPRFPSCSGW